MFNPHPPAETFEQGERAFYGRLIAYAGIAIGLGVATLAMILVFGGWPVTLYGQIVTILGTTLGASMFVMLYVIHILGIGGPVGNSKFSLTPTGLTSESSGDK
jgi:hypothetical protein